MGLFDNTQYSFWKTNSSYDLFWALSVLGGLFALDHLYLRSPLTFVAKILVNIFFLGLWWIYDASQATFNKDVVKVYGLGIPGLGPMGIGAGVMAGEKADPNHANFLKYAFALLLGGVFGLDSFITGKKSVGFFRLLCLISFIFTPIAILFWVFNVGKFFFKTDNVIEENWEYFGAPKPEHLKFGLVQRFVNYLVNKFPFLKSILGLFTDFTESPLSTLKKTTEKIIEAPIEGVKEVASKVGTAVEDVLEVPIKEGETLLSDVAGPLGNILGPIENIGENALNTLKSVGALAALPGVAASTINSVSPDALKDAVNTLQKQQEQTGGAIEEISYLGYALIGTICLIAVSGIVRTYQKMIPLQNQEQFEDFISKNPKVPNNDCKIIYFTAPWCGACKRVDFDAIFSLTDKSDKIKWYICDIDENDYTAGFCGIKTIPAFLAIINGKPQPLFSNSNTEQIIKWIMGGFKS